MRIERPCFAMLLLCLVVAFATSDTTVDARSKEQLADDVLRLLTDPDGYRAQSTFRLKRRGEVEYALVALGDDASAVLVEALRAKGAPARFNAAHLLNIFADKNVLAPLKSAYLVEQNPGARNVMRGAMARLFPVVAADMFVESLADTPAKSAHDHRIRQLLALKDARVLPLLRTFVPAEVTTDSRGALAALCLVEAGDSDAVPTLFEFYKVSPPKDLGREYNERARIVVALAAMGDERAVPSAIRAMLNRRHALADSALPRALGSRLVPHLLGGDLLTEPKYLEDLDAALKAVHSGERHRGWDGVPPSPDHVDLYGKAFLDASYAVESPTYPRHEASLRKTLAEILASLGAEGRDYLRQGVHEPHSHRQALTALASYNDMAALRELADLSTDSNYRHRTAAVSAFSSVAALWQEEAEPYWQTLIRDDTVDVVWQYVRYVFSTQPTRAAAILAPLLESDDPDMREKAKHPYANPTGGVVRGGRVLPKPGEGLEIRVATDRPSYSYNAPRRSRSSCPTAATRR
jgi:HEAT repeat protein